MTRRFTLLDAPYYDALLRVVAALADEELPFCLVGGGASQAWISSLRTGGGTTRLSSEPVLAAALRRTRDLDFATRAEPARMLTILNELAATVGSDAHVLGPRAVRLGPVSIALTLGPDDLAGMRDHYDRGRPLALGLAGVVVRLCQSAVDADEVREILKAARQGDRFQPLLELMEVA